VHIKRGSAREVRFNSLCLFDNKKMIDLSTWGKNVVFGRILVKYLILAYQNIP
jgi:hypothetical protein